MTVIAKNARYAMHSDLQPQYKVDGIVQRLRGMQLIHYGNQAAIDYQTSIAGSPGSVWSGTYAWGCGSWSGWDLSAKTATS